MPVWLPSINTPEIEMLYGPNSGDNLYIVIGNFLSSSSCMKSFSIPYISNPSMDKFLIGFEKTMIFWARGLSKYRGVFATFIEPKMSFTVVLRNERLISGGM